MTEKQKKALLKRIRHKNLTRSEIEKFCTGKSEFEYNYEVNSLCAENVINMTSEPNFKSGVFKSTPNDLFKIGDAGKKNIWQILKKITYAPICQYAFPFSLLWPLPFHVLRQL